MTDLEKCARAICANKRGVAVDDSLIDGKWTAYVGQARAVLTALLPPGQGMVSAAVGQITSFDLDPILANRILTAAISSVLGSGE